MLKLDRKKLLLISLCVGHICNGLAYSIQAPFYPSVAASKGVPPSIIGLVFGINKLTSFLISPFLGQFINSIGAKFMLLSGMFIVSICSILFGQLEYIHNKTIFIAYSFLIRIVEACGTSCYLTSSFSIATDNFQDNMFIVSLMETCYAIGTIMSPSFGGILYEVGGFVTPFATLGLFFIASGIMIYIMLPDSEIESHKSKYNVFHLMREFDFTLLMMANFVGYFNTGFLDASLSINLQQFDLSPSYVGLVFLATGSTYALFTPIWAYIGDKFIKFEYIVLIATANVLLAYNFLGPAPYIPIQPSILITVMALLLNGSGMSATSIVAFIGGQKEALNYGLPKDLATFGLVSGLWASSLSLGLFLGPTCAGPLLQYYGFRNATMSVLILNGILFIMNTLRIIFKKFDLLRESSINYGELSRIKQETKSYTFEGEDSKKTEF